MDTAALADFGDPRDEYLAAKERSCTFDLTGWTLLRLTGRDAVKFLHNFCTNDIKRLSPGESCEAFLTNVKARVVGHGFVFLDDPTTITLLASPGQAETLAPHLDRYLITEDVTIADVTDVTDLRFLTGPLAAPSPETRRCDLLGVPGFLRERPRDQSDEAPADEPVRGGRRVFEALRIEACLPWVGIDVTEDHLAPEVGRPWAISYSKGCYLGQEPIARIDALGHVNKLLRGVRLEDGPIPERDAVVIADEKEIGRVTSATLSFADDRPVALAYLRSKYAAPGTGVLVRTGAGDVPATVFGPSGHDEMKA